MAILTDASGTQYDDTYQSLDQNGNVIPSYGDYSGYTTGSTTNRGATPAGAVGTDATGTNWVDAIGRIIAPVAVSAIYPYISDIQSGGLLSRGTDMLTSAGSALNNVTVPDLTRLIPQLRLQVMQGSMSPAQAATIMQEASAMQNVQSDIGSLQGQRTALTQLAQIGQGGYTEADRAALAAAMNQTNANAAQQRAAQIQQLQMQGNAGTGAELAARLSGVQGGANVNAQAGASAAQAAQLRALQAIQSGLTGSANLNTQQFEQAAKKASAQDVVNQFNAQAQNTANLTNAGFRQAANLANFNTANTIAGTNTGIMNTQAMMPYNAVQSNFANQLDLNKARSAVQVAAGTPLVKAATDQIARSSGAGERAGTAGGAATAGSGGSTVDPITGAITKGIQSGLGDFISGGLGDAAKTVGGWFGFKDGGYVDAGQKQDLTDDDVDCLMAKLTEYKYRKKGQ